MTDYRQYTSGKVRISYSTSERDKDYELIAYEFIHKIFKEFARRCIDFYHPKKNVIMMPYYYSERRFDSIILPILHDICNGIVMTELPVTRKNKKKEIIGSGYGRVDYWCVYKDYTFIIEMKRTSDNLDGKVVRRHSMIERWQTMKNQLDTAKDDLKEQLYEKTKGVIPIGLHFVSCRTFNEQNFTDEYYFENCSDIDQYMDSFRAALSKPEQGACKPDYCGAWIVPHNIAFSSVKNGDGFLYPFVMLFCQIGHRFKHSGCTE